MKNLIIKLAYRITCTETSTMAMAAEGGSHYRIVDKKNIFECRYELGQNQLVTQQVIHNAYKSAIREVIRIADRTTSPEITNHTSNDSYLSCTLSIYFPCHYGQNDLEIDQLFSQWTKNTDVYLFNGYWKELHKSGQAHVLAMPKLTEGKEKEPPMPGPIEPYWSSYES